MINTVPHYNKEARKTGRVQAQRITTTHSLCFLALGGSATLA